MKPDMDADSEKGKPPEKKATDPDKFHFHQRNHHVAITTGSELKPIQRALYQTIIDYTYARRGPLPNDDVWLAKIQNCDIRVWRRVKQELVDLKRIKVDEENGYVYDERAVRDLFGKDVFSATQAERASVGGKQSKTTPTMRVAPPNVEPISAEAAAEIEKTSGLRFAEPFPQPFPEPFAERFGLSTDPSLMKSTTSQNVRGGKRKEQEKYKPSLKIRGAGTAAPPKGGGPHIKQRTPAEQIAALKKSIEEDNAAPTKKRKRK